MNFQLGLYVPYKKEKSDFRKRLKYGIYRYVLPFNEKREHPCGHSLINWIYDAILQVESIWRHFFEVPYKNIS